MINEFILHLQNVMGYSRNTCEAYKNDLAQFARWASVNVENARWSAIGREDIERYIAGLARQGYKPTSTNRALSSLRSLYRYMMRRKMIECNPAKNIEPRNEAESIPTTIRHEDIIRAYNAAEPVAKAVIALLYTTGIRLGEMLSLTWNDIDLEGGAIRIMGKGQRERMVYAPKGVTNLLADIKPRQRQLAPVFPMGARSARRMLQQAFDDAGLAVHCNPHALRHTAATAWAMQGASNSTIAKALGHKRLETSRKYVEIAQNGVKALMGNNDMFN